MSWFELKGAQPSKYKPRVISVTRGVYLKEQFGRNDGELKADGEVEYSDDQAMWAPESSGTLSSRALRKHPQPGQPIASGRRPAIQAYSARLTRVPEP